MNIDKKKCMLPNTFHIPIVNRHCLTQIFSLPTNSYIYCTITFIYKVHNKIRHRAENIPKSIP